MASVLLLGLILVCIGLTSGDVTEFECTDGSVCANDRVECNCTTSSGAIDWTISYRVLGSINQSWIHIPTVHLHASLSFDEKHGYNFTKLNESSTLSFYLNGSENISIVCRDGNITVNETSNSSMIIFDSGYYAKAPKNLTTTFDASGVTLQWEDTDNNCSTEYQVTVISCSCTSTSVLMYNTSSTALHINSSDLLDNTAYTYTVRGWNEQLSNNSKPFTLGNDAITSQCESPQNNNDLGTHSFNVSITANSITDDCSESCCTNITFFIRLVLSTSDPQHANLSYNISYDSITVNEESVVTSEGEWNKNIQLPRNEMHYSDSEQAKNYCKMTIPESNSASSCPMEDCEKLSGGCIAAITLAAVFGAVLLTEIIIIIIVCIYIAYNNRVNIERNDEIKLVPVMPVNPAEDKI